MFIEVETVERIKLEEEEIQKIEAVMEFLVNNTPDNLPSEIESLFDKTYKNLQQILEYNGSEIRYYK